jgi:catechol 2,3-dioxygenase-like lactoylglutathione lyase family enzyme
MQGSEIEAMRSEPVSGAATESRELATFMFHPSLLIRDRAEAERFFERAFGVPSVYQRVIMTDNRLEYNNDYPTDYSIYTWVADVWFDALQPDLYRIEGRENADPSYGRLVEIGWFVDDLAASIEACERAGVRVLNQHDAIVTTANVSEAASAASNDIALFWMHPADTGLSLELCYMTPTFGGKFGEVCFPPLTNGWQSPPMLGPNPLGVEFCSWHSILTTDLPRALKWACEVLGGRLIHRSFDQALQTENTYVWLGKSVLEFAQPVASDGLAYDNFQKKTSSLSGKVSEDVYWSIGFKVRDVKRAASHLESAGIAFEWLDDHRIMIDAQVGLGVYWCLTDQAVSSDPRI